MDQDNSWSDSDSNEDTKTLSQTLATLRKPHSSHSREERMELVEELFDEDYESFPTTDAWDVVKEMPFYIENPRYHKIAQELHEEKNTQMLDTFLMDLLISGPVFSEQLGIKNYICKAFEYNQSDLIETLRSSHPNLTDEDPEDHHIWHVVQYILKWPGYSKPESWELNELWCDSARYGRCGVIKQYFDFFLQDDSNEMPSKESLFLLATEHNQCYVMQYFLSFSDENQLNVSVISEALLLAIRKESHDAVGLLSELPDARRPCREILKLALVQSIEINFMTDELLKDNRIDTSLVSQTLLEIAANNQWKTVIRFTGYYCRRLHSQLNDDTVNSVLLLSAKASQWDPLDRMLEVPQMAIKLTLATKQKIFMLANIPSHYGALHQLELIKHILNAGSDMLDTATIQQAHLQAIAHGREELVALFQTYPSEYQPHIEEISDALTMAVRSQHFNVVPKLIHSIPYNRRLTILQTALTAEKEDGIYWALDGRKINVLHWAVSRSKEEDIKAILSALNEHDRFALITEEPNDSDVGSPLKLASQRGWSRNVKILLDSLSKEHQYLSILPKRVSLNTPLDYAPTESESVLLSFLFGKNQKLHNAYRALNTSCDLNRLKEIRDFYLKTHHSKKNNSIFIAFFRRSFFIPGHPLTPEELDLVARAVFYHNYHQFDFIQRGRVESLMDDEVQIERDLVI